MDHFHSNQTLHFIGIKTVKIMKTGQPDMILFCLVQGWFKIIKLYQANIYK